MAYCIGPMFSMVIHSQPSSMVMRSFAQLLRRSLMTHTICFSKEAFIAVVINTAIVCRLFGNRETVTDYLIRVSTVINAMPCVLISKAIELTTRSRSTAKILVAKRKTLMGALYRRLSR